MSLTVINAGLQTSLQAIPFVGHRHIGMPAAGAADCLSFALANKLVGKSVKEVALEITLGAVEFKAQKDCMVALTGAASDFKINGKSHALHRAIAVQAGDEIKVGPALVGCRSYLALSPELDCDVLLGSASTYIGAALGGYHGRALKNGDEIIFNSDSGMNENSIETPISLQPTISNKFVLRASLGPEHEAIGESDEPLFKPHWRVSNRSNRMGLALDGQQLAPVVTTEMKSSPVFPGTIQCPPNGKPILLGPDAQTTGGYPRLAHIIRADRHLIGQLRPGADIQLVKVSPERATEIYREKLKLLHDWLGPVQLW